jgi:hypothetical protein
LIKCLSFMYNSSITRIKLIQKLSDAIDVTNGTKQGHPMSAELLKPYTVGCHCYCRGQNFMCILQLNQHFSIGHNFTSECLNHTI